MMGLTLDTALLGAAVAIVLFAVALLYRVARGPTMEDRVIAINGVGTSTVVVLALLAAALDRPAFLDIAIVYALLNFLASVAISKFIVERGGVL
ncbi:monovalent cation/H+ antiporter subunit F [Halodesulfurarchaeum formicicum]|uniref:Monovalent cation/H+ antiporter subunit F n=2 Tax=Halobacteriaceae TaxID=2236 RepID=A0A1D8S4C0_9EURY|nr:monovalent cation/H+ antiporter subunit F [Halodesulfurarchaeum formicicum]APE95509.1 monovalent cation/H+ antiporter subunit F [Halodesulfurarchaeum formicicum]